MPIDSSRLSPTQSRTLDAATAARDANVITPELFDKLTDGSISVQDWAAALNVRQQNYGSLIDSQVDGPADGTSAGELAQKLFVAVNDQRDGQGMFATVARTVQNLITK